MRLMRFLVEAHPMPDSPRVEVLYARMVDDELDREIRVLEESIARMTRRLDELRRKRSSARHARTSTSGTLPSMPAVSERNARVDDPPTTRRGRR
jgi:hypothetical protein